MTTNKELKYVVLQKPISNRRFHNLPTERRSWCDDCEGYVLTKTSWGKRFCVICNQIIK